MLQAHVVGESVDDTAARAVKGARITPSAIQRTLGFATPINADARVANEIIAGNSVRHAYVGVELAPSSTGGAQVSVVQPGTGSSKRVVHGISRSS